MSLGRRIADLERSFRAEAEGSFERREPGEAKRRLLEKLKALASRLDLQERMAREEAEGNPARRIALEEVEAFLRRRVAERQRREDGF